jgi:hypothetical protein
MTATQLVDFQQISINPPTYRVSLVQPQAKKTYLKHTTYLENIMATAKSLTPAELETSFVPHRTTPKRRTQPTDVDDWCDGRSACW